MPAERSTYQSRRKRASEGLRARGLAALLLSPGSDLAYLAGYRVFASERLTCLVVSAGGDATLVVPELESPRAKAVGPDLPQRTWNETDDPYALVARLVAAPGDVAVADQMWSLFVLRLQAALRGRGFQLASDITRTVHVGKDADDEVRRVHDIVRRSQEAGYAAARTGATAASVDAASRRVIDEAGYGDRFIHRTGHGIGLDGHEHPYLVRGNDERLEPGMAFSIEPGIYIPGRFGVRIEDIAILGDDGRAEPLNRADHALAIVR